MKPLHKLPPTQWKAFDSPFSLYQVAQYQLLSNHTLVNSVAFKNKMNNGNIEEFDGISLIVWTENNKIMELKEFGCNLNTYNPYAQNDMPQFRDEKTKWF